jgi:hypothetical protein
MAMINREFIVDFPQPAHFVEYLLPKPERVLIRIDFLAISGTPATATRNLPAINPTAPGCRIPPAEFPLVLRA